VPNLAPSLAGSAAFAYQYASSSLNTYQLMVLAQQSPYLVMVMLAGNGRINRQQVHQLVGLALAKTPT
jgi:hypothetical protein